MEKSCLPSPFCPSSNVLAYSQLLLECSAHEALLPLLFSSIKAQLERGARGLALQVFNNTNLSARTLCEPRVFLVLS